MARRAAPVEVVFERVAGSGVWYVRFHVQGKLVRKSFGTDRSAAVIYVEKARTLKRSGEGVVPATAKRGPQTFGELAIVGKATMVDEPYDNALDFGKQHHRDKLNPPIRIAAIRARFGDRQADSIRPEEITSCLESLGVEPGTEAHYKSTLSLCYR